MMDERQAFVCFLNQSAPPVVPSSPTAIIVCFLKNVGRKGRTECLLMKQIGLSGRKGAAIASQEPIE